MLVLQSDEGKLNFVNTVGEKTSAHHPENPQFIGDEGCKIYSMSRLLL